MSEDMKLSEEIRQYPFQDWTLPTGCQQDWADRATELEAELAVRDRTLENAFPLAVERNVYLQLAANQIREEAAECSTQSQ